MFRTRLAGAGASFDCRRRQRKRPRPRERLWTLFFWLPIVCPFSVWCLHCRRVLRRSWRPATTATWTLCSGWCKSARRPLPPKTGFVRALLCTVARSLHNRVLCCFRVGWALGTAHRGRTGPPALRALSRRARSQSQRRVPCESGIRADSPTRDRLPSFLPSGADLSAV